MKWYVLHVFSAREFAIKESILKGISGTELEQYLDEILIPTQKTFHIRDGKKVEREKKIFNSYIIIKAELTPALISYILNIPGVTHFLGTAKKPFISTKQNLKR